MLGAQKKTRSQGAGESISGGDMEETVPTIHTSMVRCNIFLCRKMTKDSMGDFTAFPTGITRNWGSNEAGE